MKVRWIAGSTLVLGLLLPQMAPGQEANRGTPYYEDDAWYDVTEWFDGNDYNPTDEVWFRWDNERYHRSEDTGSDTDNDIGVYGYTQTDKEDDWFYDYYDTGYGDSVNANDTNQSYFDYSYWYFDVNDDGYYDGYASMYDWDEDGRYESVDYTWFNDQGKAAEQRVSQQASQDSTLREASGEVVKLKQADVRGAHHVVATIQASDDKQYLADLGPADQLKKFNLSLGDKITAQGQMVKVGEKPILIAKSVKAGDQSAQIQRSRRQFEGKVLSSHQSKVRGQNHLMVMLQTKEGQKRAIDLGAADKLQTKPQEGSQMTVTGAPVQVRDTRLVLAQEVEMDGKSFTIDRRQSKTDANRSNTTKSS